MERFCVALLRTLDRADSIAFALPLVAGPVLRAAARTAGLAALAIVLVVGSA